MRRAALGLLLALAVPTAFAQPVLEVHFREPAQASSQVEVMAADWILVLFSNTVARGEMSWPSGADGTNTTLTRVRAMYIDDYGLESTIIEAPGQQTFGPIKAMIDRVGTDWSSLYVEGLSLKVWGNQTLGQLKASPAGECVHDLMTARESMPQPARTGSLCHSRDSAALVLRPIAGFDFMPFNLVASQAHVVEWHNLGIECESANCPAGGTRETEWSAQGSPRFARETRAYERLTGEGGTVAVNGTASVIFAGSGSLGVQVAGRVRLPGAFDSTNCSTCTLDGRTMQLEGNIALSNLRMESDGALSASIGGDIQGLRLDESMVDPQLLWGAAASAVGVAAVVGLAVLVKFIAAFTRIEPEHAIAHPRRRVIHDYIHTRPGAGFREIMRGTKSASASVRRHLEILKQTGLIVEERHGKSRKFFPVKLRANTLHTLLLREPELEQLYALVERNPWLSQGEIMDLAEREFASRRTTTQHRLGRLLEGGLLKSRKSGRYLLLATQPA